MSNSTKIVIAIIIQNGKYLIAKRRADAPFSGYWEFPGGKVEPGETTLQALGRELYEEIAISVQNARKAMEFIYADKIFSVWLVKEYSGSPYGQEGQEINWIEQKDIFSVNFPPANATILKYLKGLLLNK